MSMSTNFKVLIIHLYYNLNNSVYYIKRSKKTIAQYVSFDKMISKFCFCSCLHQRTQSEVFTEIGLADDNGLFHPHGDGLYMSAIGK